MDRLGIPADNLEVNKGTQTIIEKFTGFNIYLLHTLWFHNTRVHLKCIEEYED